MNVRRRDPTDAGQVISELVADLGDFVDDLGFEHDGDEGANHGGRYFESIVRSQLSAAWDAPRIIRSRSP